jgi:hypothetical protein
MQVIGGMVTDRVKSKYFKQILSHCRFVNHKSHMNPDIEPVIQGRGEVGEVSSEFLYVKATVLRDTIRGTSCILKQVATTFLHFHIKLHSWCVPM